MSRPGGRGASLQAGQRPSSQLPSLMPRHGPVPHRCVRPDETSATVRCHAMRDGTARFALTLGRAEYFLPLGVLAKCFLEVSDKELYTRLLAAIPTGAGAAAAAAALRCLHAAVCPALGASAHRLQCKCFPSWVAPAQQ